LESLKEVGNEMREGEGKKGRKKGRKEERKEERKKERKKGRKRSVEGFSRG